MGLAGQGLDWVEGGPSLIVLQTPYCGGSGGAFARTGTSSPAGPPGVARQSAPRSKPWSPGWRRRIPCGAPPESMASCRTWGSRWLSGQSPGYWRRRGKFSRDTQIEFLTGTGPCRADSRSRRPASSIRTAGGLIQHRPAGSPPPASPAARHNPSIWPPPGHHLFHAEIHYVRQRGRWPEDPDCLLRTNVCCDSTTGEAFLPRLQGHLPERWHRDPRLAGSGLRTRLGRRDPAGRPDFLRTRRRRRSIRFAK